MKKYKEFIIKMEPFNTDPVSGVLWELDITGINEEENCLRIFAAPESKLTKNEIIQQLKKLESEGLLKSFSVKESFIEEKNWNEEWEKSLSVIKVSDRIVIKPSFRKYKKQDNEIVITIDPKMSFGTGEHASTKLIIHLMEKYIEPEMKILDVGTGTGILLIVSVKLGAKKAIGFDIDEWCFENAKENCIINKVAEKTEIRMGDIDVIKENGFDMILANIQKNILIDLKKDFEKKLKKGGLALLSGLSTGDEQQIVEKYKYGRFILLETKQIEEWTAIAFQKI